MYRLVSDYGWGDKSWVHRFMDEKEAIRQYNQAIFNCDDYLKTIQECLNNDHPVYSLERDNFGEKEDWDWMDS
jgi:hypothetical protein